MDFSGWWLWWWVKNRWNRILEKWQKNSTKLGHNCGSNDVRFTWVFGLDHEQQAITSNLTNTLIQLCTGFKLWTRQIYFARVYIQSPPPPVFACHLLCSAWESLFCYTKATMSLEQKKFRWIISDANRWRGSHDLWEYYCWNSLHIWKLNFIEIYYSRLDLGTKFWHSFITIKAIVNVLSLLLLLILYY